uniref:Calponin n=1 Tax=Bos indicus x Bos taurus TaxID=30522 RepID=A0A4W2IIN7_BOBOX
MSSTQFNKGPSYGLSAEVKNRLQSKYDPQKEAELRSWIEGLTGLSVGPDFQKGLKDGIILCTLMNKLQPGSVPKINRSMQNWHQLENLSNFIKAMVSYGMNPVDLFEANDLFESGNLTQVQVSLLALAGKAKTKGLQSGVDIGVKYSEKQERNFDDATMKAGQCVIGLQMGTNKCASQSGMTAYGTRRHLYDPKNHILPPMDHSTISLQMGTNKCASQVGRPSSPRPPCPDSASAFCVSPGKLLPSSALVSFKVGCPEAHPTLIFLDPAVITFPAVYQFDVSV